MVFSAFRFMIRGPITAAVQWTPINPQSRDPNGLKARMVAVSIKGKVSERLTSQNVRMVAECYAPVAYQRNQEQTPQGLEVDLLIKVRIDAHPDRYAVIYVIVTPDHKEELKSAVPCTC